MTVQGAVPRFRGIALFMMFTLPLGACASSQLGASAPDVLAAPRGALVSVQNRHVMDVRVYLVRPGARVRLGALGTMERRDFAVPSELLGLGGGFQLEAVPLGSTRSHMSEWISAVAGDRVEWTVAHRLRLSSVVVRR